MGDHVTSFYKGYSPDRLIKGWCILVCMFHFFFLFVCCIIQHSYIFIQCWHLFTHSNFPSYQKCDRNSLPFVLSFAHQWILADGLTCALKAQCVTFYFPNLFPAHALKYEQYSLNTLKIPFLRILPAGRPSFYEKLVQTGLDFDDGQFSERCDVDGSFFNSDAIPIIFWKSLTSPSS